METEEERPYLADHVEATPYQIGSVTVNFVWFVIKLFGWLSKSMWLDGAGRLMEAAHIPQNGHH